MTAIKLSFPWGRYYAHPWGINPVRLREAEWSPSPWRLLRTLVSAWFRSRPGLVPSPDAVALIESLGQTLPDIATSSIAFGHTVHYQPNYGVTPAEDKRDAVYKKTRHENHFVAVHGPVIFRWPGLELPQAQAVLLGELLAEVSYFGRSESLCQAELLNGGSLPEGIGSCKPVSTAGSRRISSQCRDVFCPRPGDFRITDLWARRNAIPSADDPNAPQHLVDALLSTDMKADRAEWFSYEMPAGWPEKWVVRVPRTQQRCDRAPTSLSDDPRKVAHYLRFSLQCRVPIPQRFTVDIAERFRTAALSYIGDGRTSFALHGKPDRPDMQHQHAFYLPMAMNTSQPGMLTDLHVWCPFGFTREESDVLLRVHRLRWGSGRYPANPVLVGMAMEPPPGVPVATGSRKLVSCVWRSATPFVPPLHFYRGSRDSRKIKANALPEKQLVECIRRVGVDAAVRVKRLHPSATAAHELITSDAAPPMPAWDVVRVPEEDSATEVFQDAVETDAHRNSSDQSSHTRARRVGFLLEMEFETPVGLPLPSYGHSAHFGLGLFVPLAADER